MTFLRSELRRNTWHESRDCEKERVSSERRAEAMTGKCPLHRFLLLGTKCTFRQQINQREQNSQIKIDLKMFNIFLIFIISVFAENIKIVQCPNGFFLNQEEGSCKDVDECASNSVCTSHLQNCKNTVGSFECECIDGYKAAPFGGCEEKTRCEQFGQGWKILMIFDQFSECQWKCEENAKELIESKCVCPAGYYQSGSSVVTCHDINECLTRNAWIFTKV